MCLRQARVVRNAPSRWMESSFFQSAKGKSTKGLTIWIPALLTRMSILPYLAMPLAEPVMRPIFLGNPQISRPPAIGELSSRDMAWT